MSKKNGNLTTIFCTGNQTVLSVAKSLLDEAGIKYIITPVNNSHEVGKEKTNGNGCVDVELKVEISKTMEATKIIADLVELDFDEH